MYVPLWGDLWILEGNHRIFCKQWITMKGWFCSTLHHLWQWNNSTQSYSQIIFIIFFLPLASWVLVCSYKLIEFDAIKASQCVITATHYYSYKVHLFKTKPDVEIFIGSLHLARIFRFSEVSWLTVLFFSENLRELFFFY